MTERIDFSKFGASRAFAGDLLMSWGACLVEPPAVGALRQSAADKLIRLGDLAPPKSGIPTRVVDYFCLEEIVDHNELVQLGLRSNQDRTRYAAVRDGRQAIHVIERGALKPMVRRPGQLEGKIRVTKSMTAPWHMLSIVDDEATLVTKRWNRTLAYIRYGETQDFPAREGSRRAGGVPAERPNVRTRAIWFQVPRIDESAGRVCWIKGRGSTHYAPVIDRGIVVPDNFLYSTAPMSLENIDAFGAVANLSWSHLMAEINGRRGGGDGVLHTYIRELEKLPLVNPKLFTKSQADDLVDLFSSVSARSALPITEELLQSDRQKFDLWAMKYMFGEEAESAQRAVHMALRDLAEERSGRASSGTDQVKRAAKRTGFNAAPVAARVMLEMGIPPRIASDAVRISDGELADCDVEVPPHRATLPLTGETLLDQACVVLGEILVQTPSDTHARSVVAYLTIDAQFTGTLQLEADETTLAKWLASWDEEWAAWRSSVRTNVASIYPRPQHVTRRDQVLHEIEVQARLAPGALGRFT